MAQLFQGRCRACDYSEPRCHECGADVKLHPEAGEITASSEGWASGIA